MQINKPTCSSSSIQQRDSDNCVDESAASITFKFDQSLRLDEYQEEFLDCESGKDNSEFTFTLVHVDRQSKNNPVFPLFDQNLLLSDKSPVEKVFVEIPQRASSSSMSEYDQIENIAVGPYCTWSKRNVTENRELNKKSNSTGFSKLWRLRGKVKRSNSDGRDAFVFLKGSDRKKTSLKSVVKRAVLGEKSKVVKKGTKVRMRMCLHMRFT